jgi:gamma-glutamyltranspeptidase/glutathione hydrolase
MITTPVLQTLLDRLDFGMSLREAIAAPRASQRNSTPTNAEAAFVAQYGSELCARFGQNASSTRPRSAP